MAKSSRRGNFVFALALAAVFIAIHSIGCLLRGKTIEQWAPASVGFFVLCIFVYGLVEGVSTLLPNSKREE